MRFRGDDFEQPLEVELWPEDQGGAADVSFGRTPRHSLERRGRRPARWWIGGAAVAALVGGAIVIGQGGADESAPDSTLATTAATTTDAGPGPTRARAVTSTTTTVYTPPAALATDPGWDIYLSAGGGGSAAVRSGHRGDHARRGALVGLRHRRRPERTALPLARSPGCVGTDCVPR